MVRLTVSRRWHNPIIRTEIEAGDDGGISLSMDIEDFQTAMEKELNGPAAEKIGRLVMEAVVKDVGSPTWKFRKSSLDRELLGVVETALSGIDLSAEIGAAVGRVVAGVKEESAKVVAKL